MALTDPLKTPTLPAMPNFGTSWDKTLDDQKVEDVGANNQSPSPETSSPGTMKQQSGYHPALAAFINDRINAAGGMAMGGRGKPAGWTFRKGEYRNKTMGEAMNLAMQEWQQMSPQQRSQWWSNHPTNPESAQPTLPAPSAQNVNPSPPSRYSKWFKGLGNMPSPRQTPAFSGNIADVAQARYDQKNGITQRGSDGSVQFANGATITPNRDLSAGPPKPSTATKTLISPEGTEFGTTTPAKTITSAVAQTPQQAQSQASTAQPTLPAPETAPNIAGNTAATQEQRAPQPATAPQQSSPTSSVAPTLDTPKTNHARPGIGDLRLAERDDKVVIPLNERDSSAVASIAANDTGAEKFFSAFAGNQSQIPSVIQNKQNFPNQMARVNSDFDTVTEMVKDGRLVKTGNEKGRPKISYVRPLNKSGGTQPTLPMPEMPLLAGGR